MKLLSVFKRQKEEPKRRQLTDDQRFVKLHAIDNHEKRITNLNEEFERLSNKLENSSIDIAMTKIEREKFTDRIVRRMAIIRYEIDIRRELTKWLS